MAVVAFFALGIILCTCSGVTHWRVHEEVIRAVDETVITARETCTDCNKDDTNTVTVYDREFSTIIKSHHINHKTPWLENNNRVSKFTSSDCPPSSGKSLRLKIADPKNPSNIRCHYMNEKVTPPEIKMDKSTLSCGEPVDFTMYDFLKGLAQRRQLPSRIEPEVALVFRASESDNTVDMLEVETFLRSAIDTMPLLPKLLGQIADYWRIRGETLKAIECYRTALHINPDNSEILLSLARLFYNFRLFEDVVFLTRKSLHVTQDETNAWRQYYLLAETYGQLKKFDESAAFYKKTLELNPGLHSAEAQLREIGRDASIVNTYTAGIIIALVSVVLAIIYYLTCKSKHASSSTSNKK